MATTTISLPDDQLARLRLHADASQRSLDEVVQEAVDAYLERLPEAAVPQDAAPPPDRFALDPRVRFYTAIDGAQVAVPPGMSPDEVQALLAAPSPKARGDYLRKWLIGRGARVVEPANDIPVEELQTRSKAALARIHASIPDDLTPDEIEALITETSEEMRQERIARRESEHPSGVKPAGRLRDPAWQAEVQAALERLRSTVPKDVAPEEIDAEIDAAWQEVRQERRARLGLND